MFYERNSNLELVESGGMFVIPQADEWLGGETGAPRSSQVMRNSAANVGWLLWDENRHGGRAS